MDLFRMRIHFAQDSLIEGSPTICLEPVKADVDFAGAAFLDWFRFKSSGEVIWEINLLVN